MRRPHLLQANHKNEQPHDAVWCDTETKPEDETTETERHRLWFGYAAFRRCPRPGEWTAPKWTRFETPDAFWDWVESRLHGKSRLYVFAHNWGFDAPVLDMFDQLPARGWTLKGAVIENPPIIMKWRRDPHTICVVDTLNIWRTSLTALGDSLGIPKLEMPDRSATQAEWDAYGKRDVEVIMEACLRWWDFLRDNDLGGFAHTLAAQAFRTYRHRFMNHPIFIDSRETALELARDAYVGGRTECFQLGQVEGDVYRLDINSQYPYQMKEYELPTKLAGHYRRVDLDEVAEWCTKYAVVARCIVNTPEPVYAARKDKRVIFPVGRFSVGLCTPEIVYGLERGYIESVPEAAVYEQAPIFAEYVDYFYALRARRRAEGDEVGAWLSKILLNSLYGKFAQRGRVFEKVADTEEGTIKVWDEFDAETGQKYRCRQYAHIIEQQIDDVEARDSHPAISAHVTAYARLHLWRLIKQAGRENVYYCDTDSVWTNKTGYERLTDELHDTALGKLKLEGVNQGVTIHGPKDYVIGDKVKIKGVRKNAEEIEPGVFRQLKFSSLKGLLRVGDLSAPIIEKVTKRQRRIYRKGVVGSRGRIEPFLLNTPESGGCRLPAGLPFHGRLPLGPQSALGGGGLPHLPHTFSAFTEPFEESGFAFHRHIMHLC